MNRLPLAILAQADAFAADYHLTAGGWTLMLISVSLVTCFLIWCLARVTRESSPQKLHSSSDVPPDVQKDE